MSTKSTDEIIKQLENQMYVAKLGDAVPGMVEVLRSLKLLFGNDHAYCIAMAMTLSIEVAVNTALDDNMRDQEIENMVFTLRETYRAVRKEVDDDDNNE